MLNILNAWLRSLLQKSLIHSVNYRRVKMSEIARVLGITGIYFAAFEHEKDIRNMGVEITHD